MKDYYVKLSLIINNDVSGLKKEIDIEKIFDRVDGANSNDVGKILIIGGAGVGKSTLLQYMVYQWSIGKIW
jgi:polynucleotide 5'-kinase involved in rRNA processing